MPTPLDPFLTDEDVALADETDLLVDLASEAFLLSQALDVARSVQWTAATPEPGVNGQPNNPTAATTADPDRLRLRLQVVASERALRESLARVALLRRDLDEALTPYGGNRLV